MIAENPKPSTRLMPASAVLWFVVLVVTLTSSVSHAQQESLGSQILGIDGNAESTPDESAAIAVGSTSADDNDIEQRLINILSEIETMEGVSVSVSNSVVELEGEVDSADAREEAQTLASSLEGVVKVDNQVVVSLDVSQRVKTTWDRVRQLLQQIQVVAPVLILSVAVFVMFWFVAGWMARQQHFWRRIAPNAFIATVFGSIFRLFVLLLGVLLALYLLDATSIIATVLGAAGIVGLAVGFAVRDTVENFIASILLSIRQPFRMNDFVQIDSYTGSVARLTGRATILISPDGNQIRIPNALVFKSIIVNYSRHPMRRFSLAVPVDESEDLAAARVLAEKTMGHVPGVQQDPAPQVHIQSLGETIVFLNILGWVDQRVHDLLKVQTASAIAVKTAMRNAGIVMPQSVHTVTLTDKSNAFKSDRATAGIPDKSTIGSSVLSAEGLDEQPSKATSVAELDTRVESPERDVVITQLAEEQRDSQNLLNEN